MAQEIEIREESEEELRRRLPAGTVIKPRFSFADLHHADDPEIDEVEWDLFRAAIREARRNDCEPRELLLD